MSALAWLLHQQGHSVTGSDCNESAKTARLRHAGIYISVGHDPSNVENSRAVVYSSAICNDNVELREAQARHLDVLHRQELLCEIFNAHHSIGVAGTNGKTTTSSMVAALMKHGGLDPSYLIGAPTESLGGSAHVGQSRWLVSEVCESDGHFVSLLPHIAVVTNIGRDHLDHYGSESELINSFCKFVGQSTKAILCADDAHYQTLKRCAMTSLSFGFGENADLRAVEFSQMEQITTVNLRFRGQEIGQLDLPAPGRHNILNAMAAMLAGYSVGLTFDSMIEILESFQLPQRRFQILKANGIVVVDDYAHMPEQVALNLEAAREGWPERRQIAIFQPHRYSRLSYLADQFSEALTSADTVLITDIYPAFERPIEGVSAESIVERLRLAGTEVHYVESLEGTYEFLRKESLPGDFIIGFGAGDLWQVLHKLVREK